MTQNNWRLQDEDVRAAFAPLRDAEVPADAKIAVRAAIAPAGSARHRGRLRMARAAGIGLLAVSVTATAAAAVSGTFATTRLDQAATPNAPAARNLGPLLRDLASMPAGQQDKAAAAAQMPPSAARGATVSLGRVTVDIAMSAERICFEPRVKPSGQTQLGCFPLHVRHDALPSISGRDAKGSWLTAVIPDDVGNVLVRTDAGQTLAPSIEHNVAIATVPGDHRITSLTWTDSTGASRSVEVSRKPNEASGSPVYRVDHN